LLAQDKVKILLYDFDEDQAEKKKLPAGLSKQEQMDALANTAFDELIGWVDMTVEQLYAKPPGELELLLETNSKRARTTSATDCNVYVSLVRWPRFWPCPGAEPSDNTPQIAEHEHFEL